MLLLPLLGFMALLTRDRTLLGEHAAGSAWTAVTLALALLIATAIFVLGILAVR